MRKGKTKRTAQISLKVLIGLLIGVVMLISSCSIAKSVLTLRSNDYEKSFDDLVQTTKTLTVENTGAVNSPLISVKDNAAILGFNPVAEREAYDVLGVERYTDGTYTNVSVFKDAYDALKDTLTGEDLEELERAYEKIKTNENRKNYEQGYNAAIFRNGRFGDGDLHVIRNKDYPYNPTVPVTGMSTVMPSVPSSPTSKKYDTTIAATHHIHATHFPRPFTCPTDEACLCLCEKPSQAGIPTQEYVDVLTFNPDIRTIYDRVSVKVDGIQEAFKYEPQNQYVLECKELRCESIGKTTFYMPLKSTYFQRPLTGSSSLALYTFENGFVIDRTGEFLSSGASIPKDPSLVLGKLSNSQLAACFDYQCLDEIEKAITLDKPLTQEDIERMSEELDALFEEKYGMTFDEYMQQQTSVIADNTLPNTLPEYDVDSNTPYDCANCPEQSGYGAIHYQLCKDNCPNFDPEGRFVPI